MIVTIDLVECLLYYKLFHSRV